MLNDAEFARLADLIQKTEKTPEEAAELAKLRQRATEPDETSAPAALPTAELPTGLADALKQIADQREMFKALQAEIAKEREANAAAREVIAGLKAGQDAIASGQAKVLFRHCNGCGRRLRQGEDRCPQDPREPVNHVGLNPANGVMMIVKTS